MTPSRLIKSAVAAGACAALGAIAGIAGSAAAPTHSQKPPSARYATATSGPDTPPGVFAFKIGMGGPPVHAVQIVPNRAGDGFDTVTRDSGTVKSSSGASLTLTEGTDKVTYATPTLTLPAGTTVERNFQKATLADIQIGDHVDVSSNSNGTTNVFVVDSRHWPPKPPKFLKLGGPPSPTSGERIGSTGVLYTSRPR